MKNFNQDLMEVDVDVDVGEKKRLLDKENKEK